MKEEKRRREREKKNNKREKEFLGHSPHQAELEDGKEERAT